VVEDNEKKVKRQKEKGKNFRELVNWRLEIGRKKGIRGYEGKRIRR